ncbi:bifunctional hydroxymethylpyrimidine kinase/phosphomethylpyrimidine kinase [Ornithinimicrobium tianjinense]|uniref:Hydroxymethylpyrimidine/phosphomethylpyrimidine kinase n=1 Tax=Ornithinimicrobium tianjinense TaxID=1195761 RepID=A0A917BJP9_9MICO|nr:bifunctional hydroxymethylpyrimidine kinase/phosphomethylpyrimidine kinase [Ornithinimicrobium tianjinense]GGF46085.1 hydroxymethylpyrimidine/phosphomethylpyrimidine kinase [Ornithinimicrobium tianjinense]
MSRADARSSGGGVPHVLSIAGSDPSGGAGIQADLKTFSALGAYGCAVLTSLTAQSTQGVTGVHPLPPGFVRQQVDTLVEDVRIDATKLGMLGTAECVEVVTDLVREGRLGPVVLDPVMVSTAGSRLLDEDAVAGVRRLLPHVDVVTPNLPEAAVLLGGEPGQVATDVRSMHDQARRLQDLGAARVLLKGGHAQGPEALDVWADADGSHELRATRVDTRHTHGTGCSLSSALAAIRPQESSWLATVTAAKEWLTGALTQGERLAVGRGPGPVHHFWRWW